MPIADARGSPPSRGVAGSLRQGSNGAAPRNRIPEILEGSEKLIADAVVHAVKVGMAVMLSPTSDAGALGVHVWHGYRRWKDYVSSPEELEDVLRGLLAQAPANPPPGAIVGMPGRTTLHRT